jgi:hypothetical protein
MNSILGATASRRLLCRRDGGAPRSSLLVGNTMGGLDAERAKLLINKTFRLMGFDGGSIH